MTRPLATLGKRNRRRARAWSGLAMLALAVWTGACRPDGSPEVIVYTSQDQVFAEPILRQFTEQSGIRVRTVYDSEAVKTVGLVNRLLAERDHPRCDLFWNNEEMRTRQLAAQGLFEEDPGWVRFGHRTRRLVINTNLLDPARAPSSLTELTNPVWRGKIVLAYPLFGTTATHFLALRQTWGSSAWESWCRALRANEPWLVDGNSVAVQWVGRGDAVVGLTDSDDVSAGQRQGYPIASLPAGPDMLRIPNTAGIIRGAPHPQEASRLLAFLQSPEVVQELIRQHALESAAAPGDQAGAPGLDWAGLLTSLSEATRFLQQTFLR